MFARSFWLQAIGAAGRRKGGVTPSSVRTSASSVAAAAAPVGLDGKRIVHINAGGRRFATYLSTLLQYPSSSLASLASSHVFMSTCKANASRLPTSNDSDELFLDVDGDAFADVLTFLRRRSNPSASSAPFRLSTHASSDVFEQLGLLDSLKQAFPVVSSAASSEVAMPRSRPVTSARSVEKGRQRQQVAAQTTAPVPDSEKAVMNVEQPTNDDAMEENDAEEFLGSPETLVVQICDHMKHDQGVKQHAMTITFGSDGCDVKHFVQSCRKDLQGLLSATYWQTYQTNERAAFFVTTKMSNSSADLLLTSISQSVINHVEEALEFHAPPSLGQDEEEGSQQQEGEDVAFGKRCRQKYKLVSSYVTLSPDTVHLSIRVFLHYFIFRRCDDNHSGDRRQRDRSAPVRRVFAPTEEGREDVEDEDDGNMASPMVTGFATDGTLAGGNVIPPHVGPQLASATGRASAARAAGHVAPVGKIWDD